MVNKIVWWNKLGIMSDNKTSNKRIAMNTLFLYLRMGVVLIVSLFTTRVVLQTLGVVDYGVNNVVGGFVSMFAFLNTSMSNGVQRFYNFSIGRKKDYSVRDVYNTALLIQFILVFVLLILLETFGLWYLHNKMVIPSDRFIAAQWIFQFSILSLVLVVLQIPYSAAIMAYEKMDYFAYLSLFDVIAKLCIAYGIKYMDADKLILYGALNLLITFISFFLYFSYAKKYFKELKFDCRIRKDLFKPMMSFSSWNIFGTFAYMLKGQGLNMILNLFFGPIVNTARGISYMIMNAIQGFQSNIVIAFRPQIVQSYAEGNNERVTKLFFSLSKISFLLLSIISIPIILEIKYILHLWLGDTIPDYTIPFTLLILINMIFSSLTTPVSQVVHATGNIKVYQIVTSIIVCSIVPISYLFLVLGFNPVSVYWVSFIVTIFNQIVCIILLKQVYSYKIKEYLGRVMLPCLLFLLIVPVIPYMITTFLASSFIRLLIVAILSILLSIVSAYVFVLDDTERHLVLRFIKRK